MEGRMGVFFVCGDVMMEKGKVRDERGSAREKGRWWKVG